MRSCRTIRAFDPGRSDDNFLAVRFAGFATLDRGRGRASHARLGECLRLVASRGDGHVPYQVTATAIAPQPVPPGVGAARDTRGGVNSSGLPEGTDRLHR